MHRVFAHAESGADAGELQGCAQEGALQAGAFEVVIAAGFPFRRKPDCFVGFVTIAELKRQDPAGAHFVTVVRISFVADAQVIVATQISYKIVLAAQDRSDKRRVGKGWCRPGRSRWTEEL